VFATSHPVIRGEASHHPVILGEAGNLLLSFRRDACIAAVPSRNKMNDKDAEERGMNGVARWFRAPSRVGILGDSRSRAESRIIAAHSRSFATIRVINVP